MTSTLTQAERLKLPRHKLEELKRKEDEERTKEVYQEFMETFAGETSSVGATKTFVRGEVVNPEKGTESKDGKAKLYRPAPSLYKPPKTESPFELAKKAAEEKAKKIMEEAMKNRPERPGASKKTQKKSTSNLEAFKIELKSIQDAREERRKVRQQLAQQLGQDKEALDRIAPSLDNPYLGTYDTDPNTTNLFLSNLIPDSREEDIFKSFGAFGPLASVKIMWPRSDEERARGYLCGFVAFMTRADAERAVAGLKGKKLNGFEMKMSWAKALPIPAQPVFVPPEMMKLTLPPASSGLPFNAQPREADKEAFLKRWPLPAPGAPPPTDPELREAWNQMIRKAVVKVVIPTERPLLHLIHRTIEFVVREGPMLEAMVMNRELNNPTYRFLFDNQSPAHVYYRWKLFAILQGDGPSQWIEKEFRMFEDGSLWRPPPIDFFLKGMPEELYWMGKNLEDVEEDEDEDSREGRRERDGRRERERSPRRDGDNFAMPSAPPLKKSAGKSAGKASQQLSDRQRDRLEDILRGLTPERDKVGQAMTYCVEHAESAEEIVECIAESLEIIETPLHKKIARLYLISDILSNCGYTKIPNVSFFRKFFGDRLETIFQDMNLAYERIGARLKAEQFKQRVMACFRNWEDAAVYTTEFLIRLQNIFLGLTMDTKKERADTKEKQRARRDSDGAEEDVDGVPLDLGGARPLVAYDVDGTPMEENEDEGLRKAWLRGRSQKAPGFKATKWEEVEPELVEQQAMTTSKWEALETTEEEPSKTVPGGLVAYDSDEDLDGVPMEDEDSNSNKPPEALPPQSAAMDQTKQEMSEERRKQLREIEVKVMKFQDDLESGRVSPDRGVSIAEEVAKFRAKLLEKMEESPAAKVEEKPVSPEAKPRNGGERKKEKHHHREEERREKGRSRKKRSRSRSPARKSKRRSRSRSQSPSARRRKR